MNKSEIGANGPYVQSTRQISRQGSPPNSSAISHSQKSQSLRQSQVQRRQRPTTTSTMLRHSPPSNQVFSSSQQQKQQHQQQQKTERIDLKYDRSQMSSGSIMVGGSVRTKFDKSYHHAPGQQSYSAATQRARGGTSAELEEATTEATTNYPSGGQLQQQTHQQKSSHRLLQSHLQKLQGNHLQKSTQHHQQQSSANASKQNNIFDQISVAHTTSMATIREQDRDFEATLLGVPSNASPKLNTCVDGSSTLHRKHKTTLQQPTAVEKLQNLQKMKKKKNDSMFQVIRRGTIPTKTREPAHGRYGSQQQATDMLLGVSTSQALGIADDESHPYFKQGGAQKTAAEYQSGIQTGQSTYRATPKPQNPT